MSAGTDRSFFDLLGLVFIANRKRAVLSAVTKALERPSLIAGDTRVWESVSPGSKSSS